MYRLDKAARSKLNASDEMAKHLLVTGGAGFVGTQTTDQWLAYGYYVRALDSVVTQADAPQSQEPDYLVRQVELLVRDIRWHESLSPAARKSCSHPNV